MFLSYQYRLYPFPDQRRFLDHVLGEMTILWNYALAQRRDAWTREHRSVTCLDQQARLKAWRAFDVQGLGATPYDAARDCLQRLDLGYRAAFRRLGEGNRPGFPRFRRETTSFTSVPESDPWVKGPAGTWRLKVPTAGAVPIRRHRPPPEGSVRSIVVSREGKDWFATLQHKVPDPPPPPETAPTAPVGVDLGLVHVVALSTGETFDAPRFQVYVEQRLKRLQRSLSRKQRGSNRWKLQRGRVLMCCATIRRQRRHWAHQLTSHWTARHDLIAFEDIDVAALVERNRLAKGITDAGWGMLRRMAAYKERMRSGRYVEVPTEGTTQTCSRCGKVANPPLALKDRVFRCPCGHEEDRDVNAARTSSRGDGSKYVGTRRKKSAWMERLHRPKRVGERIRGSANSRTGSRRRGKSVSAKKPL